MPFRIFLSFLCIIALAVICPSSPSSSGIYKYTDEKGMVHIVDSPEKIPATLKDEAEKTGMTTSKKEESGSYKELSDGGFDKDEARAEEEKKRKEEELNEWEEKKSKIESELSEAEEMVKNAESYKRRTTSSYSRKNYTNSDRQEAQQQLDASKSNYERVKAKWDEFKESARADAPYDWWRENFF